MILEVILIENDCLVQSAKSCLSLVCDLQEQISMVGFGWEEEDILTRQVATLAATYGRH